VLQHQFSGRHRVEEAAAARPGTAGSVRRQAGLSVPLPSPGPAYRFLLNAVFRLLEQRKLLQVIELDFKREYDLPLRFRYSKK